MLVVVVLVLVFFSFEMRAAQKSWSETSHVAAVVIVVYEKVED